MTFRTYKRTVAAGGSSELNVTGAGIACVESNLAIFAIQVDQQPASDFFRGAELNPVGGFSKVVIVNKNSTVALTVTLAMWSGDFVDRRLITAPDDLKPVSIDQIRGTSYFRRKRVNAVALQFSYIQLRNDSTDKLVVVKRIIFGLDGNAGVVFAGSNPAGVALSDLAGPGRPKFSGDAVGTAGIVYSQSSANGALINGTNAIFDHKVLPDRPFTLPFDEQPMILQPGAYFGMLGAVVNTAMIATLEWLEIDGA